MEIPTRTQIAGIIILLLATFIKLENDLTQKKLTTILNNNKYQERQKNIDSNLISLASNNNNLSYSPYSPNDVNSAILYFIYKGETIYTISFYELLSATTASDFLVSLSKMIDTINETTSKLLETY